MENIEAMLCAYIEGDLDDAGRAEIEKHLRDNPQHRQLIAELIATRDLVRNLPRVKTSGDANESLRGQVARSILLDDPDNTKPASSSGRRLPGVLVAAAIVLLFFTLGIIVYRMLGPTLKPTTFTPIAYTPSTAPDLLLTRNEPTTSPVDAESRSVLHNIEKSAMNYGVPAAASPESSDNAAAPEALSTNAAASAALTSDQLTDLKSRLRASGYLVAPAVSGKPGPILLVVHSATPQAAGDMIANFLAARTNSISWSEVPQTPGVTPAFHASSTQPSIVGQMSFSMQMSATTIPSTIPSIAAANSDQAQEFSQQQMRAMRSPLASTQPTTQSIEPSATVLRDVAKALTDKASTMPAATQPSLTSAGNEVLNRDAAVARSRTFSHIYVAQNLTARDAAELQLSLAQPDLGQPAQVYESSAAPLAENLSLPTTLPAQMSGTATFTGQSMQITLATQPSAANSTQPAATNPTMTVNLPAPVDAVIVVQDTPAAAPITPAFGSDSYQAIEPPATNPSANPPATQPTTEPIAIPSTEPTSQPSP